VRDEGFITMLKGTFQLAIIDLGSTNISRLTVDALASRARRISWVGIRGCKRLSVSDAEILRRKGISTFSGEDVFRFHLLPRVPLDLPRITTSVLKTRATLSVHKVQKYLSKKLLESL